MRPIRKTVEPSSLAEHRANGGDYDGYRDKDTLRSCLADEQRGLCCYCLSRIRPAAGQMKIEHWRCQENYPDKQLDYHNLLGACMGNEGHRADEQHCDTRKGNLDLSKNPANPAHRIEELRYLADGTVRSDDPVIEAEIDSVLNLNYKFLKNNRKATLDAFVAQLPKTGTLPRTQLIRWLTEWNGDEPGTAELPPFCAVVVYWLRKRLARA